MESSKSTFLPNTAGLRPQVYYIKRDHTRPLLILRIRGHSSPLIPHQLWSQTRRGQVPLMDKQKQVQDHLILFQKI